jgi:hypothetical protein
MNTRILTLIVVILGAALFRLVPHPPNVTPIAAIALFSGAYLADRRLSLVVPLLAMLLSDLFLGFYSSMALTYLAFALSVVLGWSLHSRRARPLPVLGAAVGSSLIFYLLTNFGSWVTTGLYPHDPAGLLAAYVAGLPFYRNSLAGDLLFTGLLFWGFHLAERRIPSLREHVHG